MSLGPCPHRYFARIGGPWWRCTACGAWSRPTLAPDPAPDTPDDPDEAARWQASTPRELGLEVAALVEAMAVARDEMLETARYETRGTPTRKGDPIE